MPGRVPSHDERAKLLSDKTESACDVCGSSTGLNKRCPCLEVWYCGTLCQNGAWMGHKAACKAARAAAKVRAAMVSDHGRVLRPSSGESQRETPQHPTALPTPLSGVLFPPSAKPANTIGVSLEEGSACASRAAGVATDAEGLKLVEQASDVEALVKAMRKHVESPAVQQQACLRFAQLEGIAGDRDRARRAGAIEALVAASHRHPDCEGAQLSALQGLRCLTIGMAVNVTRAGNAGAVEAVVSALRGHESEEVLEHACDVLRTMTLCNEGNAWIRTRAGNEGAIEALLAVMRKHVTSDMLLMHACGALYNLTIGSSKNQTRAKKAGAIIAAVMTLRGHPGLIMVQANACGIISNLTQFGDAESITRAVNAGAIELAVTALRSVAFRGHPRREMAEKHVCDALLLMLRSGKAANFTRAENAGAIEAVVMVIPRRVHSACMVLTCLCNHSAKNRARALQAGAKELVQDAIKAHSGNSGLLEQALKLLHHTLL